MRLPASLSHWAQYLNIFPEELSIALAPIVQRVSMLVGPLSSRFRGAEGEPDGFSGLDRRGNYERLLLSEWALADEFHDEFTRRAVMGEHLFLNPARHARVGARVSLALFDAGPSQLGAPRIAHLAALIALARRAEAAGATFGWGVLQQPEPQVFSDVTASGVLRLLESRSHHEATDVEVEKWLSQRAAWSGMEDVWLVGGRRVARLHAGRVISRLCIEDPFETDARRLILSARGASAALKEVVLDLPPDRVSTRLLRDPFESAVAEVQKVEGEISTASNLLFDRAGTKLFVRSQKWGVTAFNVPNSPRAGTGKPKHYRTHRWQTVAAVGKVGRAVALVSAEDHLVRLEYCRQGNAKLPAGNYAGYNQGMFFNAPVGDDGPLTPCLDSPWGEELVVLDAVGTLFRLVKLSGAEKQISGKSIVGTAQVIASRVLASALVNSRLVYVGMEWPGESLHVVSIGTDIARTPVPFEGRATRAFFGPPAGVGHEKFGLLAVELGELQWAVLSAKGEDLLARPYGASVVGVLTGSHHEPGLLALEDDRRTLTLHGRNWRQKVLESSTPIERVAVSTDTPRIAYSTAGGEVVVYSIQHRTDLCRYQQGVRS
jgi:hypothetical protein